MSIAELSLKGREYTTQVMPSNFSVYCYVCNAMMGVGTLVKRYDGATYTHDVCPSTPLRTFAPHKYGGVNG